MKIRKAGLKDVPDIVRLWKGLMSHHKGFPSEKFRTLKKNAPKIFGDYIKRCIRSRNAILLVAEERGKLVGYSLNKVEKNIPIYLPERLGYYSDLFVDSGYRGGGISSRLIEEASKWFRSKGIDHVKIGANIENKKTVNIYKHWGMVPGHLELHKKI